MTSKKNKPQQGDVVLVSLNPTKGHEQQGKRPALVVSVTLFNQADANPFCVLVPITNTVRNSPFEVPITGGKTTGVALTDQFKSLDLNARHFDILDKVDSDCLEAVQGRLKAILGL